MSTRLLTAILTPTTLADVYGSAEAVEAAFAQLPSDKIDVSIVRVTVGNISETDIEECRNQGGTEQAILVVFNVKISPKLEKKARLLKVKIIRSNIIYKLVDDVKAEMVQALPPIITREVVGKAQVMEVFSVAIKRKMVVVAGCRVSSGMMSRNVKVQVTRGKTVIHTSKITMLRHFKDEVNEVKLGQECGILIEGFDTLKRGDLIECFTEKFTQAEL